MPRTIDQQIAEAENRLQRLRTQKRKKDTRRKIIAGTVVIAEAFQDRVLAAKLLQLLETSLTRKIDQRDAEPLIVKLRSFLGEDPFGDG